MEKIFISYTGTGIKTLRTVANVILVLGLLSALIVFIACFIETGEYYHRTVFMWQQLPSVLLIVISTLLCFGLCRAIATIAENSMYANEQRKALLKKEGIELMIFDYNRK
jgi:hypothetical protein